MNADRRDDMGQTSADPASAVARTLDRGEAIAFPSGDLNVRISAAPNGPELDRFFGGYDRAFVLPNEKEELSGFRECLALNFGSERARLAAQFGSFTELVLVLEQGGGERALVGGANFICFPLPPDAGNGALLCANLNYAYVMPEVRRGGYLRRLLQATEQAIRRVYPSQGNGLQPLLIFLEMNDPLRMDPEAYAEDSRHSGLDQIQRIGIWSRLGIRIVDFDYVQPPLSSEQEPDDTLLFGVLGAASAALPSRILLSHLARFFGISVLKGNDPCADTTAARQLRELQALAASGATIALLDPRPWLETNPAPTDRSHRNLRDRLRALRR
jgi:hypothetical protein